MTALCLAALLMHRDGSTRKGPHDVFLTESFMTFDTSGAPKDVGLVEQLYTPRMFYMACHRNGKALFVQRDYGKRELRAWESGSRVVFVASAGNRKPTTYKKSPGRLDKSRTWTVCGFKCHPIVNDDGRYRDELWMPTDGSEESKAFICRTDGKLRSTEVTNIYRKPNSRDAMRFGIPPNLKEKRVEGIFIGELESSYILKPEL